MSDLHTPLAPLPLDEARARVLASARARRNRRIVHRYATGMPCRAIATRESLSREWVSTILRTHGVTLGRMGPAEERGR